MTDDLLSELPRPLSEGERRLVDATRRGDRAQCEGTTVRAAVIRALATSKDSRLVRPAGIAMHGAQIQGELDLEGCDLTSPLLFFGCTFGTPGDTRSSLMLRDARLRRLGLYECVIHGGVKAERMQIESAMFMGKAQVHGTMRLRGARIGGSLNLEEALFEDEGNAIVLDSAEIRGNWLMRGATVRGTLRFSGARIGGSLLAESARYTADDVAILADGAQLEGAWVLNRSTVQGRMRLRSAQARGLVAVEARIEGAEPAIDANGVQIDGDWSLHRAVVQGGLSIPHAEIQGLFSADKAKLSAEGTALNAHGISLQQGMSIEHAHLEGGLSIEGARVGRDLQATGIHIHTPKGRAISADVIRVQGNWVMRGAKLTGAMRLSGARIEGQLAMTESEIQGRTLAIRADGIKVGGGWFMGRAKVHGVIRFPASTIGNQLRFSGSQLRVDRGVTVYANGSTVMRGVVAAEGFRSSGGLAFDQARIHGTLDLRDSQLVSATMDRGHQVDPGPERGEQLVTRYDDVVISLVDSVVDRIKMPRAPEHRPRGIVDLSRARTGSLDDHADAWHPHEPGIDDSLDHMVLDGFTYDHLENPAGVDLQHDQRSVRVWEQRLHWLEGQSGRDLDEFFKPSPWVQLVRRLRAQGFHEDARQVSIARLRRHRRSSSVLWRVRIQSQLLDWFALFGYNPWRTVLWIVAFVSLFTGLWAGAATQCEVADCSDETVFVRTKRGEFAEELAVLDATYPEFSALSYSFDLFVPVVDFGHREFWRPNTRYQPLLTVDLARAGLQGTVDLTVGELLYVATILEMILGLILTSLAVTGFTGLITADDAR
ncbi:MAG: hypothetical protein KTR31_19265 [Myxococcales bacterium]|nr:hypothetical protein [Myxococcales bacterium]